MSWPADTAYLRGLDVFTSVVDRFPPDGWQRPSPCAGWTALDVLGHVGTATRFGAQLLTGAAPAWRPPDPPGAAVEGDPVAWWGAVADAGRRAAAGVDLGRVVESPMGPRTVAEGLSFPALDLFVHGWDLARSGGMSLDIPAEAIAFAHAVIDPVPTAQVRSGGVFAVEFPVPSGASATEAFLAWTGRDPRWPAG